jgi:hypothetical protein
MEVELMYATIPVYYPSIETASRNGEKELWLESRRINLECKRFIEDRASTAYNTRELDMFIKDLVEQYGVERAMYVLSRTVQYMEWDGRFSAVVKERVTGFEFADMHTQIVKKALTQVDATYADKSLSYVTNVHPCIVNDIFKELMKIEKQRDEEAENMQNMELDEGIGQER